MSRVSAWGLFAGVLVAAAGVAVRAQSPPAATQKPGSGFVTSTTAVVVDVVVRDAKGAPIVDLKPGDFELFEDEVKQKIASVELVAPGRGTAPGTAAGASAPAAPGTTAGPPKGRGPARERPSARPAAGPNGCAAARWRWRPASSSRSVS